MLESGQIPAPGGDEGDLLGHKRKISALPFGQGSTEGNVLCSNVVFQPLECFYRLGVVIGNELPIPIVVVDRATVGGDPTVQDIVQVIEDVAVLPLTVDLLDHALEGTPVPLALRIQITRHRGHAGLLQDGLVDPEDP